MNLADPELELIDPTPNVHALFLQFDRVFFWAKLNSRAVVRWSKRMYSCAGVCSYEGRGGLCDIALSEPLLKLRPRKDLIETLLHEMIHAFLFITCRDQDRDGHGPNFKEHMYRINKAAGLNISIYHDFHEEVRLYQTHWWRCNGPCQTRKPYFGIVRQSQNRAPGPSYHWWSSHQKTCGGTFIKIKEPEMKTKKAAGENKTKKAGDITKYVNKTVSSNSKTGEVRKPLTPLVKNATGGACGKVKSNGGNTLVVTQKSVHNSPISKPASSQPPPVFSGKGQTVDGGRKRTNSVDVAEAVRNVWANKQLPGLPSGKTATPKRKSISTTTVNTTLSVNTNNNKIIKSPPAKIKKIDDYFKNAATSILKDVYGEDFRLTQSDNKIVAKKVNLVDCPVCRAKVDSNEINRHLDECLNKDVIEKLSKDDINIIDSQISSSQSNKDANQNNLKGLVEKLPGMLPLVRSNTNNNFAKMFKEENGDVKAIIGANTTIDLTNMNYTNYGSKTIDVKTECNNSETNFDSNDINTVKAIVKKINFDKHIRKSDNFLVVKEEPNNVDCGFLPSFLDDIGSAIKTPAVKIEPGTSKDFVSILTKQNCPCCGVKIDKPMAEHLDECLSFFDNNTTAPEEGASTSFANNTIVIDDDDDIFDETLTMNATGTKTPCPCCLEMIEMADMNSHLNSCLT